MNNKICPHCQNTNIPEASFCSNCGASLSTNINTQLSQNVNANISNNTNLNTNMQQYDEEIANKLGILSLILYYGGSIILGIISAFFPRVLREFIISLSGLCPLGGIVAMIYGRIKYPNNKLLKIAMWSIIISIILGVILVIVVLVACGVMLKNMDTSGCG